MAPRIFARPCVLVLAVAVAVSRLMSTNGRAVRLQQQQQQRHHLTGLGDGGAGYSDPELDIDRLYDLMNSQNQPRQQLQKSRQQSPVSAAAAAVAGPASLPPVDIQQQQQQVNQSKAANVAQPRYHFEVHSVQHIGEPFQTAGQKLRTVVRQAAAVEYHLKDVGDGRQTLLDDNEIHRKRLAASLSHAAAKGDGASSKSSPKQDGGKALAEAEARFRIEQEQLRQLQEQEQRYYDEGELDDEEMQQPYEPEPEAEIMAAAPPQSQSVASKPEIDEINRILKQEMVKAAAAADAGGRGLPSSQLEPEVADSVRANDVRESQPLQSLPVKKAKIDDVFDESSMQTAAGSASSIADVYFLAVVIGCAVAGIAGFMFAGLCWYRLHRKMKEAGDVDYPAYGVTGPVQTSTTGTGGVAAMPGGTAGSPGDRKLAQSAQMYHYQHQKQQMIASERLSSDVNHHAVGGTGSDVESEEENEDGDYTVFECPGLATNGEMEVRNPMFNDPTPVGTPADTAGLYGQAKK